VSHGTQCRFDVGNVTTQAQRREDGTYAIRGQKIFISGGEQDLTENIVHLVLARITGDPPGTKGLSLFIVPKYLPATDGTLGRRNDLLCSGVEEKMGIHGLSTCAMAFGEHDDCVGYLLGAERKGMRQMFQMMNEERLFVGLQGLSYTSVAYQHAAAYAQIRRQGTHVSQLFSPTAPQVPIVEHPDVKRMLLWMKAYGEGMRILTYFLAYNLDLAAAAKDESAREANALAELLIPICKAGNTDTAWLVTSEAIQVYGGYGYCKDYPVEQYARECKILSIVEGTNGIQAIDLLLRKVLLDHEGYHLALFRKMMRNIMTGAEGIVPPRYLTLLGRAMATWEDVITLFYNHLKAGNVATLFGQATWFLMAMYLLCLGGMHLWSLTMATKRHGQLRGKSPGESSGEELYDPVEILFYEGKMLSSQFFLGTEFRKIFSYFDMILQEEPSLTQAKAEIFGAIP